MPNHRRNNLFVLPDARTPVCRTERLYNDGCVLKRVRISRIRRRHALSRCANRISVGKLYLIRSRFRVHCEDSRLFLITWRDH